MRRPFTDDPPVSPSKPLSNYYDPDAIAAAIDSGAHREVIGGMWDEIGDLQLAFLKAQGLMPDHHLLDIGCGSLRLGVRAVPYLNAGNYWGTDLNRALLEAGYEREIEPAGLAPKLPRGQLVADADFAFPGIPHNIDCAIATSVFTHLPLEYLGRCLASLGVHVTSPCTFFFSIFTPAPDHPFDEPCKHPVGGKTSYPDRDPFHYKIDDLHAAAEGTPWAIEYIGNWKHPRDQMMVKAEKA